MDTLKAKGVERDFVNAYAWWMLSSAQGNLLAKTNLAALDAQMTDEEIEDARQMAKNYSRQLDSKDTAATQPRQ